MIVDYTYYQNVYGGKQIPADTFDRTEVEAAKLLHKLTYYRLLGKIPHEAVKMGACAACEAVHALREVVAATGIKSENNDGYSVTYTDDVGKQVLNAVKAAISPYLPPSDPLRFAGVT